MLLSPAASGRSSRFAADVADPEAGTDEEGLQATSATSAETARATSRVLPSITGEDTPMSRGQDGHPVRRKRGVVRDDRVTVLERICDQEPKDGCPARVMSLPHNEHLPAGAPFSPTRARPTP